MKPLDYQSIDHTGDLGFRVWGASFEELLVKASAALTDTLVEFSSVEFRIPVEWKLGPGTREGQLVAQLQEILFQFDARGMVFADYEIAPLGEGWQCRARGEKLDREKHGFKTEIKAVTYHQLKIVREKDGNLSVQVILDV